MPEAVTILGIESSCDDTAAALVRVGANGHASVLSSVVADQTDLHAAFGAWFLKLRRARTQKSSICALNRL